MAPAPIIKVVRIVFILLFFNPSYIYMINITADTEIIKFLMFFLQSNRNEREIRLVEAIIEFRPENFIHGIPEVCGFLG